MEESKECRLVTLVLVIQRIVAYELARPLVEGTLFNSHPIPKRYAIGLEDRAKPDHRRSKLEYSGENGEWKLGKNVGCHILWSKGTLSLARKTLKLPVQTRHAIVENSFVATTIASTFVAATTIATTFVATTTTAMTYVTATTTAASSAIASTKDSSITATAKDCSAAATNKDRAATAQEDNFAS
jgi:hypothetical protein